MILVLHLLYPTSLCQTLYCSTLLMTVQVINLTDFYIQHCRYYIALVKRPGEAGAFLQTPLLLIYYLSESVILLLKYLPKPYVLGTLYFEIMFTSLHVTCHITWNMCHVTCHISHVKVVILCWNFYIKINYYVE